MSFTVRKVLGMNQWLIKVDGKLVGMVKQGTWYGHRSFSGFACSSGPHFDGEVIIAGSTWEISEWGIHAVRKRVEESLK